MTQTTNPTIEVGGLVCYMPRPINYLRTVLSDIPVSVRGLTDKELRQVGREWTKQLIAHARRKV